MVCEALYLQQCSILTFEAASFTCASQRLVCRENHEHHENHVSHGIRETRVSHGRQESREIREPHANHEHRACHARAFRAEP